MERIALSKANFERSVARAAEVLAEGGTILYPTDTLYGLGADAFSDEAVDSVYSIKGRDERKPMHCVVTGIDMAAAYAEIGNDARILAAQFFPGALTLILRKRLHVEHGIARGLGTIGVRAPRNDFCIALAGAFGRPYTATSANRSDEEPETSVDAILEQLGGESARIALAVDAGELPPHAPSTVVDLSGEEPVILREGAIAAADIWDAVRDEQ